MPFRPHLLIAAVVFCAGLCAAQTPQPPTERSHVERFSTPEMRAERVETETSARLAANPKDTEALNLRALARMRLGRYQEAGDDPAKVAAVRILVRLRCVVLVHVLELVIEEG